MTCRKTRRTRTIDYRRVFVDGRSRAVEEGGALFLNDDSGPVKYICFRRQSEIKTKRTKNKIVLGRIYRDGSFRVSWIIRIIQRRDENGSGFRNPNISSRYATEIEILRLPNPNPDSSRRMKPISGYTDPYTMYRWTGKVIFSISLRKMKKKSSVF